MSMTTSEPTTGEIVRALRELVYEAERKHETQLLCTNELILAWAHDLERKESDIAALTARAEQAERERDDAVVNINLCMNGDICKACVSWKNGICSRKDNRCDPKYRGLQQKNGEEK